MITILSFDPDTKEVKGWLIANDIDEARRKAQERWLNDLAAELYRMTFPPTQKKYAMHCGALMLQH